MPTEIVLEHQPYVNGGCKDAHGTYRRFQKSETQKHGQKHLGGLRGQWQNNGEVYVMDRNVKLALLGNHEAAKRLTDAGVIVPCPGCGGENIVDWYRHNEVWYQCDDCGWQGPSVYSEGFADTEKARLAWNTRAPILSESELKKLEEEA